MPFHLIVAGVLCSALLLIALSILWSTLKTGISPMPSSSKATHRILALARNKTPTTVYELGAGFGTLAVPLARLFPHAKVITYELSWFPWCIARLRASMAGLGNLSVRRADFLAADLSDADLLVSYLYPGAMHALAQKIESQPSQAYLISNTFALPGYQPIETHRLNDIYRSPVYLYALSSHPNSATSSSEPPAGHLPEPHPREIETKNRR